MGIEYDIISDSAKVGYTLGKGGFSDERFSAALRSNDPVAAVVAWLTDPYGNKFSQTYAEEIAREIVAFATQYPDWRIIDDCSSDINVCTDEQYAEQRAEDVVMGDDPDEWEKDFPRYKQVGTRYRETASSDAEPMAIEPDSEAEAIIAEMQRQDAAARKVLPIRTIADIQKLADQRRDQAAREAKLLLRFEPGTLAPRTEIVIRAVSGQVMCIKAGRHLAWSLTREQLLQVEIFKPQHFEVQTPDGELWVMSLRINGHDQLVRGGASSALFGGGYDNHLNVDSGQPQQIEIALYNNAAEPRRFAAGMEGRALLKAAP